MMLRPTIKIHLKYSGFMVVMDSTTNSKITDRVRVTIEVKGDRLYCGRHEGHMLGHVKNTYWYYKLSKLDAMHFDMYVNKMALRFLSYGHVLYIVGDGLDHLLGLYKDINTGHQRLKCPQKLDSGFKYFDYFNDNLTLKKFNKNYSMNDLRMTTLLLENIAIKTVPVNPMNSPIKHLSLSGSELLSSCKDKFWNWVSDSGVCKTLQVLELDSMQLECLPFEIMYMEKIRVLSVANNKLTILPQYLAELKDLNELYINNNMLKAIPRGLIDQTFRHINYADNDYIENNYEPLYVPRQIRNDKMKGVMKLSHLSFLTLIYNRIKLNRDLVPSKLKHYFDQFGSCIFCHKLVFGEYAFDRIEYAYAETLNLMCENVYRLPWISLECNYSCRRKWIKGERYGFHLMGDNDYNNDNNAIFKVKKLMIDYDENSSDEVISDYSEDDQTN